MFETELRRNTDKINLGFIGIMKGMLNQEYLIINFYC